MKPDELFRSLRERQIFRVGAIYLAFAWLSTQVIDILVDRGLLPEWVFPATLGVLFVGLALVLALTWVAERDASPIGGSVPGRGPWPRLVRSSGRARVLVVLGLLTPVLLAGWISLRLVRPAGADGELIAGAPGGYNPARIAVLYFDDHSPEQDLGPVAAGFTEALIHELSQVPQLDVVTRNGVRLFRNVDVPLDSMLKVLEAGTLVEGSVIRSGSRLRVTVQFIDANTGSYLLSRTLDRPWDELLTLLDDVPREVANDLRSRLGIDIRLKEKREGTSSLSAWTLVRRAEALTDDARALQAHDVAAAVLALARADSLLEAAEEEDPRWLEPLLLRGWVAERRASLESSVPGLYHRPSAQVAHAHAERALEREPRNARALELRGHVRFGLAEIAEEADAPSLYRAAEQDLRSAVAADAARARAWVTLSELLRRETRFAEARRAVQRAHDADAFLREARGITWQLFHTAFELEEIEEAAGACQEGRNNWRKDPLFVLCELLLASSQPPFPAKVARAWVLRDSLVAFSDQHERGILFAYGAMQVAKVIGQAGLPDSARAVIARARSDFERARTDQPASLLDYDEAHARLILGERDEALRLLESYLEEHPQRRPSMRRDWWFRDLWEDRSYQVLSGSSPDF